MATAFAHAAANELKCPVCLELFAEPRIPKDLPECGHVCCEECLQELFKGKQQIECPECRATIKRPAGGVSSFRTNFRLRNLASSHPGEENLEYTEPICTEHDEAKMRYYCSTCKMLACQACLYLKHQGLEHNCIKLKEECDERRKEMQTEIEDLKKKIVSLQIASETLSNSRKMTEDLVNEEGKKINNQVQEVIKTAHEQAKRLIDCLEATKRDHLSQLDEQLLEITQQVERANTTVGLTGDIVANKLDSDFIQSHDALAEKLQLIRVTMDKTDTLKKTPHVVKFVPQKKLRLGRLVQLVQEFGKFTLVQDVACSPDGLLATCDLLDEKVTIYHKQSGLYEKKLTIGLREKSSGPRGVCFFPDGHIWITRCTMIEQYSNDGAFVKEIDTKDTYIEGQKFNVWSVTTTGNRTRALVGDVANSVITEHNSHGSVTKTLNTTTRPFFVAYVNEKKVAFSSYKQNNVCVMDIDTQKETLKIHLPEVQGVCYDVKNKSLLISRNDMVYNPTSSKLEVKYGTGRIEQYCIESGRFQSCLAEGLYQPFGLTFISDGELAVADNKNIKIYKII